MLKAPKNMTLQRDWECQVNPNLIISCKRWCLRDGESQMYEASGQKEAWKQRLTASDFKLFGSAVMDNDTSIDDGWNVDACVDKADRCSATPPGLQGLEFT